MGRLAPRLWACGAYSCDTGEGRRHASRTAVTLWALVGRMVGWWTKAVYGTQTRPANRDVELPGSGPKRAMWHRASPIRTHICVLKACDGGLVSVRFQDAPSPYAPAFCQKDPLHLVARLFQDALFAHCLHPHDLLKPHALALSLSTRKRRSRRSSVSAPVDSRNHRQPFPSSLLTRRRQAIKRPPTLQIAPAP
jgi:hypothetical protein